MKFHEIHKAVLDNMKEAVHVCDLHMNILYMNPASEKISGLCVKEALGKKQSEVFGKINGYLHGEAEYTISPFYEGENVAGSVFITREMASVNSGSRVAKALTNEIGNGKKTEEQLIHRIGLERVVNYISMKLIRTDPLAIDGAISDSLRILGEFSDVDRCFVSLFCNDPGRMDFAYEWRIDGLSSVKEEITGVIENISSRCLKGAVPHKSINVRGGTTAPAWEEVMEACKLQSFVAVPMGDEEILVGFLGLGSALRKKVWSQEDLDMLSIVSGLLASAFNRKRMEETLRLERDKLRGVLEAIVQGMFIVNSDYIIEHQNDIFTRQMGERKGEKCHVALMKSETPCDFCMMEKIMESGEKRSFETTASDGRFIEMSASRFLDSDGKYKVIEFVKDMTEKKSLEAEAVRAAHLASIGELAAGVAHEINNPVNGIINYAEILEDRFPREGLERDLALRIMKEAERVAKIVKNLLSFARDRKEEHSPANVEDILSDALELVEKQLEKDGCAISVDIPSNLPKIKARSQEIQQVFLNILSNARYSLNKKYPRRHENKLIEICAKVMGIEEIPHVCVSFKDNGVGIKDEMLHKISAPFFSTKPRGEGTGLGLSISHGIIKNHGGRLRFESKEGEFTRAFVEIPVDNGWSLGNGFTHV